MSRKKGEGTEQVDSEGKILKIVKTRRERFISLAPMRVNKVLKSLKSVGNCANVLSYEYSPEEAERVLSAIDNAILDVRHQFTGTATRKQLFSL